MRVLAGTLNGPTGPISCATTADGVVHAAVLGDLPVLTARWTEVGRQRAEWQEVPPAGLPEAVRAAVARYAAGDPAALDEVAVDQPGSAFAQAVWAALRSVPAGSTITYAALAAAAGRPGAVRAAASACARNLVAPFVPCHRAVRTDGGLGGYAFGELAKRALLTHEGVAAGRD